MLENVAAKDDVVFPPFELNRRKVDCAVFVGIPTRCLLGLEGDDCNDVGGRANLKIHASFDRVNRQEAFARQDRIYEPLRQHAFVDTAGSIPVAFQGDLIVTSRSRGQRSDEGLTVSAVDVIRKRQSNATPGGSGLIRGEIHWGTSSAL